MFGRRQESGVRSQESAARRVPCLLSPISWLLSPVSCLLFLLAGCAHRYTVCIQAGDLEACRKGYTKHDARVAAETLGSLPGVDRVTVERTPKHDRQTKSGATDVLD
jgi:hypothetical protein